MSCMVTVHVHVYDVHTNLKYKGPDIFVLNREMSSSQRLRNYVQESHNLEQENLSTIVINVEVYFYLYCVLNTECPLCNSTVHAHT